jgi:GNAT superfamily N-acetyltransferase
MQLTLRRLSPADWPLAYPVVRELRTHLDEAEFLARTARMADRYGSELYVAFDEAGAVVGAMGMRPLETYNRGWHLHVDDLVTVTAAQGHGVGTALLALADREARSRGMTAVYLDSRPAAEEFYRKVGFTRNTAIGMNRRLT